MKPVKEFNPISNIKDISNKDYITMFKQEFLNINKYKREVKVCHVNCKVCDNKNKGVK